jgi:hypothetical protein
MDCARARPGGRQRFHLVRHLKVAAEFCAAMRGVGKQRAVPLHMHNPCPLQFLDASLDALALRELGRVIGEHLNKVADPELNRVLMKQGVKDNGLLLEVVGPDVLAALGGRLNRSHQPRIGNPASPTGLVTVAPGLTSASRCREATRTAINYSAPACRRQKNFSEFRFWLPASATIKISRVSSCRRW